MIPAPDALIVWLGLLSTLWSAGNWAIGTSPVPASSGHSPSSVVVEALVFLDAGDEVWSAWAGPATKVSQNDMDLAGRRLDLIIAGRNFDIRGNGIEACVILSTFETGASQISLDINAHSSCVEFAVIADGAALVMAGDVPELPLHVSGSGAFFLQSSSGTTLATSVTGSLVVEGSRPNSPVTLIEGGTLAGNGTVGVIDVGIGGGVIAPGGDAEGAGFNAPYTAVDTGDGTGTLNTGSVTMNADTLLVIELMGAVAGSGYDQLNVAGSVALGGAELVTNMSFLADAGSTTFTIIVNDGGDPVTGTFEGMAEGSTRSVSGRTMRISYAGGDGNDVTLTVLPVPVPLIVGPLSLPTMTVGAPVDEALTVSAGTGPYTFGILGGALPAGLSLSASGDLTGTPTTAGAYAFTARATDSLGNTGSRPYTGTIGAAPEQITIESPELPAITAGAPFSFQLEIDGGVAPYTCEVTGGALPAGITLDDECLLSGTATEPGDYSFTITVADSADAFTFGTAAMFATATFTFTGTVAAAVPSMPAIALGILAVLLISVGAWGRGWGG